MTEQDIIFKLQEWFIDRIDVEFDSTTPFLESGDINSFDIICLVLYIEDTFDIQLQVEDLQSKDFNTLAGLARLIGSLARRV